LYWAHSNTDITFEIHVKTEGWASFGLSRHGDMQTLLLLGSTQMAAFISLIDTFLMRKWYPGYVSFCK
jgi:hypothetical protein